MTPRFDRRPDPRAGSGGRSPWRRPERRSDRPDSRSEVRPEGRRDDRGDSRGEPRGDSRRDGRGAAGRPEGGFRRTAEPYGRRREVDSGSRWREGTNPDGREDRRRSERGAFSGRSPSKPTFGKSASVQGSSARGRFTPIRSGPARTGPPPRFADRSRDRRSQPLEPSQNREASPAPAAERGSGDAERFGVEPAADLIWGRHSAQATLESGRPVHRIWCTPEMRFSPRFLQLLRDAKASGVLVEEVTWARLGQITSGAVHQGIALQTAAAETLDLATLIDGCRGIGEPPLLMAVDGLTDPHNLGAIVRSAEALGAHGMVLPQRRSAGLTGSVAKVAAGALEHLPVARVVNLNRALDTLKQEGYRVVGLAEEGTVTLEEADLDGPLVVVTGSEGEGLSMLTRRSCDQLVRIPLRGATPSLNASVATALLVYEVARRGWMRGLRGSSPPPRIVRPALPAPAAVSLPEQEQEPKPEPEPELELELEPELTPELETELEIELVQPDLEEPDCSTEIDSATFLDASASEGPAPETSGPQGLPLEPAPPTYTPFFDTDIHL